MADPTITDIVLTGGGYAFSSLLGALLFLVKRELGRHDAATKDLEKRHEDTIKAFEHKLDETTKELEETVKKLDTRQREKWDAHAEKHENDAEKRDLKRDKLVKQVQDLRADLLSHCADMNERFLTKDEFVSSTSYLTKKTDEVMRLLQSVENILARR